MEETTYQPPTPEQIAERHARYQREQQEEAERLKQSIAVNKEHIFDALAAENITSVTVEFNGSGDEGQIEEVNVFTGPDTKVAMPNVMIKIDDEEEKLSATIEQICFDFLEVEHGGWEINDGSYGTFTFNVAERKVMLDFYERYTEVNNYEDEF